MVAEVYRGRVVTNVIALGLMVLALSACTGSSPLDDVTTAPQGHSAPDAQINRPNSRVGELGQEDLPQPEALGHGWGYRVDYGNAEDGYLGSGQPATAREPASVLAAITPLGCRPGTLPMPASTLEVTYAKAEVPGVGVVLRFDDAQTARRFFTEHTRVLKRCTASRGVALAIEEASDRLIVTTRTEQLGETPGWTEGVVLEADEVTLIAVADPSPGGVRAVVSALT